eukprot:TRINITY_DN1226_c0_g1_i13.p1 TRINITY_DN1226_c0_g1~~TRINITY_DN1226_c0_g1_i13.p1  ORF type:complete len:252 (-),score=54.59 TRINITY_DN1226_c0_g1_i13:309-1064(-)
MGGTQSFTPDDSSLSKPIPIPSPSSYQVSSLDKRTVTNTSEILVPVVFRWSGRGRNVFLETWQLDDTEPVIPGATNRIEMQFSHVDKDFSTVLRLPPGRYKYHFEVDGVWLHAEDQPFFVDGKHISNTITVERKDFMEKEASKTGRSIKQEKPVTSSPPGEYSYNINQDLNIVCGEKPPSKLPPHLERALLNCKPIGGEPDQLPLPHRVMVNHIYERLTPDNEVVIFGLTRRYKEKFVTTVFYKAVDPGPF